MTQYEIKQSRMTRDEIQRDIDLIRLAYRDRGCEPLNHRRRTALLCVAFGMIIGTIIATFTLFLSPCRATANHPCQPNRWNPTAARL